MKYEVLVIGSGPAGLHAAIQAAKLGASVALVERQHLPGGVSVHTGTIPSKTIREAVLYLTGWRQRGFYGRGYRVKESIGIEDLMQRLEITVRHEVDLIHDQLTRNEVTLIRGEASFIDAHSLSIDNGDGQVVTVEAANTIIATGTRPSHPEGVPFDGRTIIDSDDILRLDKIPRTLIVVGAGVTGVEYASIFSALDIEVTLIDGREKLLGFLDRELVEVFKHHMREHGATLRLGEKVVDIGSDDKGHRVVHLASGKQASAELVLYAAGRMGCTTGLQLANAGLEADARHRLAVDENYRTPVEHIYAVGDVIGFPALASTSMEQGRQAACHAMGAGGRKTSPQYPIGIYSVPEISMIGKNEQELKAAGIAYEVGLACFRETARGQILGLPDGMLKLIFSLDDRRLLGVHIAGEGATELIHIGQAALVLGGTLDYFVESVFNYPTLAEAYKIAALDAHNRMPS